MNSLSNHLAKVRKEEEKKKRRNSEINEQFNVLFLSIFRFLEGKYSAQVEMYNDARGKKITIKIDSYIFTVLFSLNALSRTVRMVVSEDGLLVNVRLKLKLNEKNKVWKIQAITHGKIKYTLRDMRPSMIEDFLIILVKYL